MTDFNAALYKLIGEKVKGRRCEMGFSQEDLASKVKILSRTSISNIEMGRHQPPLHVLTHISSVLNTEIHFLLPTNNEVQKYIATVNHTGFLDRLEAKNLTENQKTSLMTILNDL